MKLYERIENNNFDEIDKNRAIELIEGGNGHLVYNENYFKLQKENEELKFEERRRIIGKYGDSEIHDVINRTLSNDYIPVQKVKDKIEKIDEELEIMKVDNMYGRYKEYGGKSKWERLFATKYGMHDALQELLEGRK